MARWKARGSRTNPVGKPDWGRTWIGRERPPRRRCRDARPTGDEPDQVLRRVANWMAGESRRGRESRLLGVYAPGTIGDTRWHRHRHKRKDHGLQHGPLRFQPRTRIFVVGTRRMRKDRRVRTQRILTRVYAPSGFLAICRMWILQSAEGSGDAMQTSCVQHRPLACRARYRMRKGG